MCRILIVDDHRDVRDLIGEALLAAGHEIESAANGSEALEWLTTHVDEPPCVVVLDLVMPVMDGWDFLDRFRREPVWKTMPVIVLSASLQPGMAHPVLKAEAFWAKPVDDTRFSRIHELCPVHRESWPTPAPVAPTN